jgi:flagellar hook-basal body complex protein FliE
MTAITPAGLLQMRSQILQQNAALQKVAQVGPGGAPAAAGAAAPERADFTAALKGALNQVSAMQEKAGDISEAYERGDVTDIAQVMLTREQANVGFQATVQVRNKLLSAYKDIMSMPV